MTRDKRELRKVYGGGRLQVTLRRVTNYKGEEEIVVGSSQSECPMEREGQYYPDLFVIPLAELKALTD